MVARRSKQSSLAAAFGAGLLGCGEIREDLRFEVEIDPLTIVEVVPGPGTLAEPTSRVDLCFSAELDPRALDQVDATLHSSELLFDAQQDLQLFSWRAPGSRTALATERWCPGSVLSVTPSAPLQPGITYRVQLAPAVLGWAGEALDTDQAGWQITPEGELRWFYEFQVAGSPGDDPPEQIPEPPPGPSLTDLFAPGEIFDPERAACGCHQTADELARERLDLSNPEIAWAALVLRTGLEPTEFPMISPRKPAESYLIQKLTRTAQGDPLHAIHGEPMPPDGELEHADRVRVAHWIASGALL